MRQIIESSSEHLLNNLKILKSDEFSSVAFCQRKLITRQLSMNVNIESPQFLKTHIWGYVWTQSLT